MTADLPAGWVEATLGDVTEPFETIDPRKLSDQEFRYVDIGAIDNASATITTPKKFKGADAPSRARRVLKKDDVLFSTVRTYLKNIAMVPKDLEGGLTSTGICLLRTSEAIEPKYLFRWVLSEEFISSISQSQDGTLYPAVRDADVFAAPIPLPPLPEQRRIVRKLDRVTAHSTKARTHLTALKTLVERYKAAVLGSIFGGMRAEEQSFRALSLMVTSGSRGWAKYYSDTGPLFIRVGDTKRGSPELDLSSVQHVSPPSNAEGQRTRLQESDIVVTITADLGRVGIVPNDLGEAYINQHVALIRLKEPDYSRYIGWFLISSLGQKQLFENDRGATKSGLGLDDIRAVSIPLPPLEEQREIVRRIDAAFARIDLLAAEAERALTLVGHLDQRILERAFSGGLVSQNPDDEPAAALLARIKATRAATPAKKRRSRAKA